ncbi:hypothetical protein TNCV_1253981 [Trichonephila clavipes]|nr:hypothetical protein TNCV_1253981 [Trichonephila clavipes]
MEFLTFWKIPGMSLSFRQLQTVEQRCHYMMERASHTPKEPVNSLKNQPCVTFCSHSPRPYYTEHACLDNVPGTNAERRARYTIRISVHYQHVDQFVV